MKKRTFFTTLLLFLIFFNSTLFLIISIMLRDRIHTVKDRALSEHYVTATMMWKDLKAFDEKNNLSDKNLSKGLTQYANLLNRKKISFVLFHNDSIIFQNQDLTDSKKEFIFKTASGITNGIRNTGFRTEDITSYYITGSLPSPYEDYILFYSCSLEQTLQEWKEFRFFIFTGGALVSLLMSVSLLLIVQKIFSPLSEIAEISEEIAKGCYEKRLPVKTKNELAHMAESFNNMADKIQGQIRELDMLSRQKQEFIDNFAHELKTPLTAIYGYSEYLQKVVVSEQEKQEALHYIMSECQRIQNMEKQLLDLALLRNNSFVSESVSVADFFHELQSILLPLTVQKKITLSFSSGLDYLICNKGLLELMLINLINNAIQSCQKEGTVLINAYTAEAGKCIEVRDNGRGMDEGEIKNITEAFYRIDKSRSREDGGAGLGLAICSKIAEAEQIKMKFKSSLGHGTSVFLYFTTS